MIGRLKISLHIGLFALASCLLAVHASASEEHGVDEETIESLNLLSRAVEFHGHLGPYVVLGLKAGLAANELIGKDPFSVSALVETELSPPKSCFADGVQVATGCSLGKRNIELKAAEKVSVSFTAPGKRLKLSLKDEVETRIRNLPDRGSEELERLAMALFSEDYRRLFDIRLSD